MALEQWAVPFVNVISSVSQGVEFGVDGMGGEDGHYVTEDKGDDIVSAFEEAGFSVEQLGQGTGPFKITNKQNRSRGCYIDFAHEPGEAVLNFFDEAFQ